MIKAVFFDVDGTLVSMESRKIPESAAEALKALHAKGVKIFISTGRHLHELDEVRALYDFDGYVLLNGQYCLDGECNMLHKLTFSKEDVMGAVEEAKKNEYPIYFTHGQGEFINMLNEDILNICKKLKLEIPAIKNPEEALNLDIYQLSACLPKEYEKNLMGKMKNSQMVTWFPGYVDIIPIGGGKHEGMRKMLEHHGLTMEEAMSFGDGGNDISMIKAAKIGVAMGNASEKVKQEADYVTDTVDNDGIEKALKHFGVI